VGGAASAAAVSGVLVAAGPGVASLVVACAVAVGEDESVASVGAEAGAGRRVVYVVSRARDTVGCEAVDVASVRDWMRDPVRVGS